MFALRRLLNRYCGTLPFAVRPFDQVASTVFRLNPAVHVPESWRGVIATWPSDTATYEPAVPLLGPAVIPEIIDQKPRYRTKGLAPSAPRILFTLTSAGVAGDGGLVYAVPERVAVQETVRQWRRPADRHPLLAAPRFPRAESLTGTTLSLGSLGAGGYYHFLLEALPRWQLARPWIHRIDHILANGRQDSFHRHFLEAAGVPLDRVRWLTPHAHFHCEQLLFTNDLSHDTQPTPWLVETVRAALDCTSPPAPSGQPRRLWISRQDADSRHLTWEKSLLERLTDFESVELSRLNASAQIALFQSANVVAGPHGAGLTNVVFSPPGVKLVEFFPDTADRPQFSRLVQTCQGAAARITTDFQTPPPSVDIIAQAVRDFAA